MNQELITQILTMVVQVIIPIVGGYIINYLRIKVGTEKLNQYYKLSKTVVDSVEQTFGSGNGADKKEEAIQALRLLSKGRLSEDQIERMIEAAVYETNTLLKINGLKENM